MGNGLGRIWPGLFRLLAQPRSGASVRSSAHFLKGTVRQTFPCSLEISAVHFGIKFVKSY